VPVVDPPRPLAEIIGAVAPAGELRICLWEGARAPMAATLQALATVPTSASVIIGPEGGLTSGEAAAAGQAGWHVVSFGPRLLRTETAGPAIVSALQARYGDLS
jgi:16S rRNA (uracil1498-N3)-methyltransferase